MWFLFKCCKLLDFERPERPCFANKNDTAECLIVNRQKNLPPLEIKTVDGWLKFSARSKILGRSLSFKKKKKKVSEKS